MRRTLLKILTWMLIAAWFVVVMGFVSDEAEKVVCTRIEVHISDTVKSRFVTETDVRQMLAQSDIPLQGYLVGEIHTRKLEATLEKNPYISNAEVCKDISGRLEVRIDQRIPLVRVMPEGNSGFYLDRNGYVLPLSSRYTAQTMLVTGYIEVPDKEQVLENQLNEVLEFCLYLANHPLWSAQIVQVYRNRSGEFELIPRVGGHQILFGELDQWEKKLRNLELLYRQGFAKYGWNTYETINLKYTNQVICSKR
jgi:cell division protein FtsQ